MTAGIGRHPYHKQRTGQLVVREHLFRVFKENKKAALYGVPQCKSGRLISRNGTCGPPNAELGPQHDPSCNGSAAYEVFDQQVDRLFSHLTDGLSYGGQSGVRYRGC